MKIYIVQINGIIYITFFLDEERFSLFLNIKYNKDVKTHKTPNNIDGKLI